LDRSKTHLQIFEEKQVTKSLNLGAISENLNNDLTVYVDADWEKTDKESNSG